MSHKTVHCIISGHVQGVYFRVNTQNKAQDLGLTGWVRNCTTGKVELKATGEDAQLRRLIDWLPRGVPAAKVDDIESQYITFEPFVNFEVMASG